MRTYLHNRYFYKLNWENVISNFKSLTTKLHYTSAIVGFFIVLVISLQVVSGTLLAFSLIPEPMMIPIVRDEEDINVAYMDIIFFSHERGVDTLFLVFYAHLFRKIYIEAFYLEQESN